MKKTLVMLMALSHFAAASVLAEEGHLHGATHQAHDEQCARECEMLLKNCAQEVDSIQLRIKKLSAEINEKGANTYTLEELTVLDRKLKESNELLKTLQKPR
jgi:peptidoglycan hydrolase CwlO-like protein